MRIDTINVHIHPPAALAQALLAAIARPAFDEPDPEAPAAADTAAAPVPPAIGEPWPGIEGSVYAGLTRAEDGQPDGHLVLLAEKPEADLPWKQAIKWAGGLGNGSRLPTRWESALLYANLREQFDTDAWYWTSTQCSASRAWFQYFYYGTQLDDSKSVEARARAVRRFDA